MDSADSCVNNVESGAEDDDDTSFDNGEEVNNPAVDDDNDDPGYSGDDSDDSIQCQRCLVLSMAINEVFGVDDEDNWC